MEPKPSGSCPTKLTAPPRLSSAVLCASGGIPIGIVLVNSVRYMVVPILPMTAMPRAPPSSPVVSEIADAAPARSGGADPTTKSVVSVNTGARPKDEMTNPVARKRNDVDASIWISNPNPIAATARPPAIIGIGLTRRTILGVKVDPTTNAKAHGSIHMPASSGDRPRTSCRYCEINKNIPKAMKTPSKKVISAALNVGKRNN